MRLITVSEDIAFMAAAEKEFAAQSTPVERYRVHPGGDRAILRARLQGPALLLIDGRRIVKSEIWTDLARARAEGATALVVRELGPLEPLAPKEGDWAELRLDPGCDWTRPRLIRAIGSAGRGEGWANLPGDPASWRTAELSAASGKASLLAEVSRSLAAAKIPVTRRGRAIAVLEELVMNALYDAHEATSAQRKDPGYALSSGRRVRVAWSTSAQEACFRVADDAGVLGARKLHDILRDQGRQARDQATVAVTRTPGRGGGVGLFLVLRNSKRFAVYVRRGQLTEVYAAVSLSPGADETLRETITYFDRP